MQEILFFAPPVMVGNPTEKNLNQQRRNKP
jgi:hypothetical protein